MKINNEMKIKKWIIIDDINSFLYRKYLKIFIVNINPLINGNPNKIAEPNPGTHGPDGEIISKK